MYTLARSAVTALVLGITAFQASAHERWFDFVNNSNRTVTAVRASHIDRTDFGRDLLGNRVVRPGSQIRLDPVRHQNYCRFDIKIEFDNGQVHNIWDVNLCEATKVETYRQGRNGF